jgi:hypothetical protein
MRFRPALRGLCFGFGSVVSDARLSIVASTAR